jgi:predicted GIY-YIG superfamily endonuclease
MIYVLQFRRKIGNKNNSRGQASYYLGWCEDGRLKQRLEEHRTGRGAALTRWAANHGIDFDLVLVIPGSRNDERRLKNWKKHRQVVRRYERESLHHQYA